MPTTNVQLLDKNVARGALVECSPALPNPALEPISCLVQLVLHHAGCHARVRLSGLDEVRDSFSCAQMRVCQDWVLLLIGPYEIAHVPGCDGQDYVGCGDADCEGNGRSEEDVAVARDDRSGHGCDKNVQRTREYLLAGFSRWR